MINSNIKKVIEKKSLDISLINMNVMNNRLFMYYV